MQAEEACLSQKLVQPSAYMSRASAIDGPGTCGISHPFKIAAFAGGSVGLTSRMTLGCPIIPSIDTWLAEVVQPAATTYFGTSVAEVRSGSYSCRPRNHRTGAKLSEHSFGNAIDIMGFRLSDGREVTIVRGWKGEPDEQDFLREVFVGACGYFTTVLGPGSDAFHYDHFHLDLARHDPRGERRVCKPVLKFTPRQDAYAGAPARRVPQPAAWRSPQPQPEIDVEEDQDPFVASTAPPSRGRSTQPVATANPASLDRLPLPITRSRGDPYGARPPSPVSASAYPLPPARSPVSAPAPLPPLPPGRAPRGHEPIPVYEPPPAQRSGPIALQPPMRLGQPIY